jgi:hypothetical protein
MWGDRNLPKLLQEKVKKYPVRRPKSRSRNKNQNPVGYMDQSDESDVNTVSPDVMPNRFCCSCKKKIIGHQEECTGFLCRNIMHSDCFAKVGFNCHEQLDF